MRELAITLSVLKKAGMIFFCVICLTGTALSAYPVIKTIIIKDNPLSVEFEVTGRAPVKVIRIADKEVLVAIKNVTLAKGYKIKGKDNPAIESVNVERLDGNVVAVVVTGKKTYGKVESAFNKSNTLLTVALNTPKATVAAKPDPKPSVAVPKPSEKLPEPKAVPEEKNTEAEVVEPATQAAVQEPPKQEPAAQIQPPPVEKKPEPKAPAPAKKPAKPTEVPKAKTTAQMMAPPVYVPPKRISSQFRGDIGDMHRGEDPLLGCEARAVENALLLIKKDLYKEAYAILDQYMYQENFSCLEQVYYLKAYVYYKGLEKDDFAGLITAERMFQDALVSYSKSRFVPFAYAAMGIIQTRLNNSSAAEGYFNIVRQEFPEYSGMPEIEYYLAGIYDEKEYTDKALKLYKKVFQSELNNSYITDAGVGYGKALYDKRQYFDALSVLNYVVKNDVKKVYESPDLLTYTGDANFELGLSKQAREDYVRLLNLFPDIPNRDMILSKVGDAYGMENNEEKALKIYELVREKYPDTMGYINASIGVARYLKSDPEKIEIYQMVKTRFPENTYARIAMMRLAEIYQKNGEYNKCIQEIEDLLSTHPRGLRYEAVKLMQRAYEALFKEQLKDDEYTSVLNRYELEHIKLDKMGSRLIPFHVGMSYLKADLYEEAFNQLISAYKLFKRVERPPALLFGLGLAMDESGRDDDALKLMTSFSKRFPKDINSVEALRRVGEIYLEKGKTAKADATFKKAYGISKKPMDRGNILMAHANVYEKKGDSKGAAGLRERAVKAYAQAPGKNYQILTNSYKTLGNTYLELKSYVQAADAFSKALSFSEGERAKANIGFLLGDAYQKGNVLDKAKETFEQVANSYDSVWARLAQQRLSTLDLAGKMINS